jgi:hypothetical protein
VYNPKPTEKRPLETLLAHSLRALGVRINPGDQGLVALATFIRRREAKARQEGQREAFLAGVDAVFGAINRGTVARHHWETDGGSPTQLLAEWEKKIAEEVVNGS